MINLGRYYAQLQKMRKKNQLFKEMTAERKGVSYSEFENFVLEVVIETRENTTCRQLKRLQNTKLSPFKPRESIIPKDGQNEKEEYFDLRRESMRE